MGKQQNFFDIYLRFSLFYYDLPSATPHVDVYKRINERAFQGPTVHKWPWVKVKYIFIDICEIICIVTKNQLWKMFYSTTEHFCVAKQMCCKQRWTSNPMGITQILIFSWCLLLLTEIRDLVV